jgi:hypothetical protein
VEKAFRWAGGEEEEEEEGWGDRGAAGAAGALEASGGGEAELQAGDILLARTILPCGFLAEVLRAEPRRPPRQLPGFSHYVNAKAIEKSRRKQAKRKRDESLAFGSNWPCKKYLAGECKRGDKCQFSHASNAHSNADDEITPQMKIHP